MIVFFQHVYRIFEFRIEAERQRERIRHAFENSHYPYQVISIEADLEKDTLERLQLDACQGNSLYYCYIHLKGITHPGDAFIGDWRELMEYFMIDCWRQWREKLERGADAVGVNLEPEPWPHYAGNFFALKNSAVKSLTPVAQLENPEMWPGTSRRKDFVMATMHDSKCNHYTEPYPRERYR